MVWWSWNLEEDEREGLLNQIRIEAGCGGKIALHVCVRGKLGRQAGLHLGPSADAAADARHPCGCCRLLLLARGRC